MSEEEQIILPEGFNRLEYIESTGTQWIDTEVIPNNETGLYLKAYRINGGNLFSAGAWTNNIRFYPPRFNMQGTSTSIEYGWENYYVLGYRNTADNLMYESWLNFCNSRKTSIQTQSNFYEKELITTLPSLSHTIYIFALNYNGSASTQWAGRIYEVKISQGNEIVRHFVPAFDTLNSEACMYEVKEGKAYYNQGTGNFLSNKDLEFEYIHTPYNLPAGFKKCVYLQSDGTQWINTQVVPNTETGLYFKALQLSYGNFVPVGLEENSYAIYPPRYSNKDLYYKWGNTSTKIIAWDKADDLIFSSYLNFYNSKIVKFNSADTDVYSQITSQTGTFTIPICLFSWNYNGSYNATTGKWGGRIYRAQITQGDTLIRDFVPCLDTDNRPCMFDLITQEAYYNQSGGTEFSYCIEHELPSDFVKLKYLEDNGTQFIDTKIVPNNETGLYVDAQQNIHTNTHVMASGLDTNSTGFGVPRFLKGTANTCGFMWKSWVSYGSIGNGTRFEGYLNFFNDRKANLKAGGTTERINNLGELGFTPTASLYMFKTNYSSHGNWNGRIYRAKITQGVELIRDFVPAYDTKRDKPCMYDLINNVAYYNDGTDEFLHNRDFEGTYTGYGIMGGIGNRLGNSNISIDNSSSNFITLKDFDSISTGLPFTLTDGDNGGVACIEIDFEIMSVSENEYESMTIIGPMSSIDDPYMGIILWANNFYINKKDMPHRNYSFSVEPLGRHKIKANFNNEDTEYNIYYNDEKILLDANDTWGILSADDGDIVEIGYPGTEYEMRVYEVNLYNSNNELISNLKPYEEDGVQGLYCSVRNIFLPIESV